MNNETSKAEHVGLRLSTGCVTVLTGIYAAGLRTAHRDLYLATHWKYADVMFVIIAGNQEGCP